MLSAVFTSMQSAAPLPAWLLLLGLAAWKHATPHSDTWLAFADFPGTVVAVTHDRYFLDNVAGWILELDRGGLANPEF